MVVVEVEIVLVEVTVVVRAEWAAARRRNKRDANLERAQTWIFAMMAVLCRSLPTVLRKGLKERKTDETWQ